MPLLSICNSTLRNLTLELSPGFGYSGIVVAMPFTSLGIEI
jgi:hypothetical protein